MDRNLVFPVQPPYQEPDGFEAGKPQPYLEAKLYIERIEQENKTCQEENCIGATEEPLPTEGPELLDHGVSLTVYPITVPSMHFTCATVQWDMPQSPAEHPDVEDFNCSDEAGLDWTVNPMSSNRPHLSRDVIDLICEEETGQNDTDLQEGFSVTIDNEINSCQTCDTQDTDVNVCVMPSSEEEQVPFKDKSEISDSSRDGEAVRCESSTGGSSINTEELVSPEALEEEYKQPEQITQDCLTEPKEVGEDACKEKEDAHSKDEDEKDGVDKTGMSQMVMMHIGDDQTASSQQENEDTKQIIEPDILEDSDQTNLPSFEKPESAEQPPDCTCDARQVIEADSEELALKQEAEISQISELSPATGNSEILQQSVLVATLDRISDDETRQTEHLQHAEAFQKMQQSVWAENQEEPTCAKQIESSVQMEPEYKELDNSSSTSEPSEHSNELEPSIQHDTLADESSEVSQEVQLSESSTEREPTDQSAETESSSETQPCASNTEPDNTEQTAELDQPQQTEHTEYKPQNEDKEQLEHVGEEERSLAESKCEAEEQLEGQMLDSGALVIPYANGRVEAVDREEAQRLAERLYKLDNVQRTDVVRHLDKDNEFSRAVGEEYLKFFDFADQSLDEALRSFLKEVVLIGETQERERVLERFSGRYQQCNPDVFSSAGAVLTLTCAVMLLNTDLHGQNVGKAMSATDFVSNLDGMNEGENFSKDLIKTLYSSIKNNPLEWAVEEKELAKSMVLEQDSDQESSLRSKSNPFQSLAHDKKATVFQKGFLKRKAHADIDGKRTPWGKRSWKIFYAVLKGMVLYLQKDEYRKDWQNSEEVLSVHHALAERAEDYTKRPHVFRLQTADWRVFLFEAASTEQMNSWIGRINLVSALYSSPPFPAAVGSQRKFCRPILPATQSSLNLEKQLHSHAAMLQSFQEDLSALQQGAPEGRKARARELEEHRQREEYLQHERSRYEVYVQMLEVWQKLGKSTEAAGGTDLTLFDQEMWKGAAEEDEDHSDLDVVMKRSHSSPSLELELAPPPVVKVRRNISERRTYRKIVIPRRNKEV